MMNITYRFATEQDLDLLANWNYHLIQDEGQRNRLSLPQLRDRMGKWIKGDYKAVVFESNQLPLAYALYREDPDEIHLIQLYVDRKKRRQGVGHYCIDILRLEIWPKDKRLIVEALVKNESTIKFWRSIGFSAYRLTLEIMPEISTIQDANVGKILNESR
ncbi:MAG: GNAT family N-acetyltransferase [Acidobacteriota bacterium]|jgi:ribosomal protein S18 acetylase RimI-like enzyme